MKSSRQIEISILHIMTFIATRIILPDLKLHLQKNNKNLFNVKLQTNFIANIHISTKYYFKIWKFRLIWLKFNKDLISSKIDYKDTEKKHKSNLLK